MTTLQQPQATESHNTDVALSLQNVTISYGCLLYTSDAADE